MSSYLKHDNHLVVMITSQTLLGAGSRTSKKIEVRPDSPAPDTKNRKKLGLIPIIFFVLLQLCLFVYTIFIAYIGLSIGNPLNVDWSNSLWAGLENISLENRVRPVEVLDASKTDLQYGNVYPDTLCGLTKNELLLLGIVPIGERFTIQDEYKGVKIVGSDGNLFDPTQLKLVKYFIDITPESLIKDGPAAIVMTNREQLMNVLIDEDAAAFSSGPYVFFDKRTFVSDNFLVDKSVDMLYYTFVHELAHVLQFNSFLKENPKVDIKKLVISRGGSVDWIDLVLGTEFMKNFASRAGWSYSRVNDSYVYELKNKDTAMTTEYGKRNVAEDMAETLASVFTDNLEYLSKERIDWAYNVVGANNLESMLNNKIPIFRYGTPVYIDYFNKDENKRKLISSRHNYSFVDLQTFLIDKSYSTKKGVDKSASKFSEEFGNDLLQRGWQGTFQKARTYGGNVEYKGFFDGLYRDMYVEIISLKNGFSLYYNEEKVNDSLIVVIVSGYDLP